MAETKNITLIKIRTYIACPRRLEFEKQKGKISRLLDDCRLCRFHEGLEDFYVKCSHPPLRVTKKKPKYEKDW